MTLSLWQKTQLYINKYVFIRWEKQLVDFAPVYLFRCRKHGLIEGTPKVISRFPFFVDDYERFLECPNCGERVKIHVW